MFHTLSSKYIFLHSSIVNFFVFLAASLVERSAFVSVKCIKIAAFCPVITVLLASSVFFFFMESPVAIAHLFARTSSRYPEIFCYTLPDKFLSRHLAGSLVPIQSVECLPDFFCQSVTKVSAFLHSPGAIFSVAPASDSQRSLSRNINLLSLYAELHFNHMYITYTAFLLACTSCTQHLSQQARKGKHMQEKHIQH